MNNRPATWQRRTTLWTLMVAALHPGAALAQLLGQHLARGVVLHLLAHLGQRGVERCVGCAHLLQVAQQLARRGHELRDLGRGVAAQHRALGAWIAECCCVQPDLAVDALWANRVFGADDLRFGGEQLADRPFWTFSSMITALKLFKISCNFLQFGIH